MCYEKYWEGWWDVLSLHGATSESVDVWFKDIFSPADSHTPGLLIFKFLSACHTRITVPIYSEIGPPNHSQMLYISPTSSDAVTALKRYRSNESVGCWRINIDQCHGQCYVTIKGFTSEKSVKTHHPSRVPDFAHGVLVRVTISGDDTRKQSISTYYTQVARCYSSSSYLLFSYPYFLLPRNLNKNFMIGREKNGNSIYVLVYWYLEKNK